VEGNAAGQFAAGSRQQQASLRRCVIAGQTRQFLIKTLEAQVEADRGSVLLK
jgi:hypothetical protein